MENKINIAELLKDCPKGMELDCTMYDNATFGCIMDEKCYPIQIQTPEGNMLLSKYGCMSLSTHSKCVIFPKDKTTWEGFVPPCKFKDGDIITCSNGACTFTSIFKDKTTEKSFQQYCSIILGSNIFIEGSKYSDYANPRFATFEEKEKLFQAIKNNGYKWNTKTKTLEKLIIPKFRVGDKIVDKSGLCIYIIKSVSDEYYGLELPNGIGVMPVKHQDDWELVLNKFDINTLKPFDKVLVRFNSSDCWQIQYFERYDKGQQKYHFICLCECKYEQCIPYEQNKHLLNTTNDCDNFYKTW